MLNDTFPPTDAFAQQAHVDARRYRDMYRASLLDPMSFWAEQSKRLDWITAPTKIKSGDVARPDLPIKWFEDGVLNVSVNCIDRHLAQRADQTALIWESEAPGAQEQISYRQLHQHVCRLANVLRSVGISKGDRVIIYLPMIPEAVYAMLACARIGAVHAVVFAGFSSEALARRIEDCGAKLIITADGARRGGHITPLKSSCDNALLICGDLPVLVVESTGTEIYMRPGRDIRYSEKMAEASPVCCAEPMGAEDPLFILYTSGSTGPPKGIVHTCGGYLLYTALTHEITFDHKNGDVIWCTANIGWITGHSYLVVAPLERGP